MAFAPLRKADFHLFHPQVETLIDQRQTTLDKNNREKIYSDALDIIHEDVPLAWVYQQVDINGMNERRNWEALPDERLVVFDRNFKK